MPKQKSATVQPHAGDREALTAESPAESTSEKTQLDTYKLAERIGGRDRVELLRSRIPKVQDELLYVGLRHRAWLREKKDDPRSEREPPEAREFAVAVDWLRMASKRKQLEMVSEREDVDFELDRPQCSMLIRAIAAGAPVPQEVQERFRALDTPDHWLDFWLYMTEPGQRPQRCPHLIREIRDMTWREEAGGELDYKPMRWWKAKTRVKESTLIMATRPERKKKRVRTRTLPSGETGYCVQDGQDAWPSDMTKAP